MRWLPGSLATPTRQPAGGARVASNNPLTRGLVALINAAQPAGDLARIGAPGQSRIALPNGMAHAGNNSSLWTQPTQPLGSAATLLWVGELPTNATSGAVVGVGNAVGGNQVFCLQAAAPATQPRALIRTTNGGGITTAEIAGYTFNESVPGVRVFAVRYDGTSSLRVFLDGRDATGGNASTGASGAMSSMSGLSIGGANRNVSPILAQAGQNSAAGALFNFAVSDAAILEISRNPWQLFEQTPRPLWAPASGVTVYRPGSDVIVTGWTATGAASIAAALSDASLSNFGTSPDLSSPATLTWQSAMPAGSYSIPVTLDRTGASGSVRLVLLDAGGAAVGTTAWQAAPATAAEITFSVTTSATSTQFRIEVQA